MEIALLDHSGRMAEHLEAVEAGHADPDPWQGLASYVEAVEAGHADPDPWQGFASYVEAVGVMQARDHGIADLVTMGVAGAPEIEALRARAFDGLVRLVERARAAGVLRADFTTEDVVV
jgi:hypothetical protein